MKQKSYPQPIACPHKFCYPLAEVGAQGARLSKGAIKQRKWVNIDVSSLLYAYAHRLALVGSRPMLLRREPLWRFLKEVGRIKEKALKKY